MGQHRLDDIQAPALLRDLQGWLLWRYEPHDVPGKPDRKIPYYIDGSRRSGSNGSPKDRARLGDFDAAVQAAKAGNYTGVGIAMLPEHGITALDFDDVRDDLTGDIVPEVEAAVQGLYTEISPSGRGLRCFVTGSLGDRKNHGKPGEYGFEIFTSKMFVTFTGDNLGVTEIGEPNKLINQLIDRKFPRYSEPVSRITVAHDPVPIPDLARLLAAVDTDTCDYLNWIKIGMAIHYETDGSEEGFILWDSWSANAPDKYTTTEHVRSKWDTFGRNIDAKPTTAGTIAKIAGVSLQNTVVNNSDFEIIPGDKNTVKKHSEPPPGGYFNIRTTEEFVSEIKPISWMIKGLLPRATLGVIFGSSGAGKSFIALDMCASLSTGTDWNCLKIKKKHRVLYVVAEGVAGFINRLIAYCNDRGLQPSDLSIDIISDASPNLMDATSVSHLIDDIRRREPYDLIVMDTFAQVTPGGNENSGEDMGRALSYCKTVSQTTGAMVLLVHHSGKDSTKGERGWSGIRGAADVVLSVTREGDNRIMEVSKGKDSADGGEYGFILRTVVLGQDEDGDDITSCVLDYCEAVHKVTETPTKVRGNIQQLILGVFATHEITGYIAKKMLVELVIEEFPEVKKSEIERSLGTLVGQFLEKTEGHEYKLKNG